MLSQHRTPFWFVLQVKCRSEQVTAQLLRSKGYQEFVPTYQAAPAVRKRAPETPLFPGYVFCRFDSTLQAPVVTTPGVIRVVGFGNTPACVCEEEIEAIRTIVRSNLPAKPHRYLVAGQKVRVREGPLLGLEGKIVDAGDGSSLIVSITLLQRAVAVSIDRRCVEPLSCSIPEKQE